jgi:fluoride ion exporter CrcB/FEX
LGGLTTFSTFAFEVHAFTQGAIDAASQRAGWAYLAASVVGGLIAVALGARVGALWASTS